VIISNVLERVTSVARYSRTPSGVYAEFRIPTNVPHGVSSGRGIRIGLRNDAPDANSTKVFYFLLESTSGGTTSIYRPTFGTVPSATYLTGPTTFTVPAVFGIHLEDARTVDFIVNDVIVGSRRDLSDGQYSIYISPEDSFEQPGYMIQDVRIYPVGLIGATGATGGTGGTGGPGPTGDSFLTLYNYTGTSNATFPNFPNEISVSLPALASDVRVTSRALYSRTASGLYAEYTVPHIGNSAGNAVRIGIRSSDAYAFYFLINGDGKYTTGFGPVDNPSVASGTTDYPPGARLVIYSENANTIKFIINGVVVRTLSNSTGGQYGVYISPESNISSTVTIRDIRIYPIGAIGPTGPNGPSGPPGSTVNLEVIQGAPSSFINSPTSVFINSANSGRIISTETFDVRYSALYAQFRVSRMSAGTCLVRIGVRSTIATSAAITPGFIFTIKDTSNKVVASYGSTTGGSSGTGTPVFSSNTRDESDIYAILIDRNTVSYTINGILVGTARLDVIDSGVHEFTYLLYIAALSGDADIDNIRMYPTGMQGPSGPMVEITKFVSQKIYHIPCTDSYDYDNNDPPGGTIFYGSAISAVGGGTGRGDLNKGDLVQMRTPDNLAVQTRFSNSGSSNYWYVLKRTGGGGFGVGLVVLDNPSLTQLGQHMLTTIQAYTRTAGTPNFVTLVSPSLVTCAAVGLAPSGGTANTSWAGKPITFATGNSSISPAGATNNVVAGTIYYLVTANFNNNAARFTISKTPNGSAF
jgi:hypothetical protein